MLMNRRLLILGFCLAIPLLVHAGNVGGFLSDAAVEGTTSQQFCQNGTCTNTVTLAWGSGGLLTTATSASGTVTASTWGEVASDTNGLTLTTTSLCKNSLCTSSCTLSFTDGLLDIDSSNCGDSAVATLGATASDTTVQDVTDTGPICRGSACTATCNMTFTKGVLTSQTNCT